MARLPAPSVAVTVRRLAGVAATGAGAGAAGCRGATGATGCCSNASVLNSPVPLYIDNHNSMQCNPYTTPSASASDVSRDVRNDAHHLKN